MNSNRLWIALLALGFLGLLALVGYFWSQGPAYGEIEGRVTRGGVPLEHVQVVFYPEENGPRSWALTDKDGHFETMTDAIQKVPARKGAPVGKYRIALVDMDEPIRAMEQMVRVGAAQTGLLDPSALPPNKRFDSPFHDIEIKPGKNWLDLEVK